MGTNPTFSGRERTVEVYVLDVDDDFYGFDVGVDVEHWLRGQERFPDIDALLEQIGPTWSGPGRCSVMIFFQTPTGAGGRLSASGHGEARCQGQPGAAARALRRPAR